MGADLGDEKSFYRPDRWNPEGYFEQPDIHRINMPLVNGMLWKFSYFFLPSTKTILRRGKRMSSLIRKTYLEYDDILVKETRFCLTMPAWMAEGARFDKVIICLRHPYEVARSIQKRNYTLLSHGYYLFNEHNSRILEHIEQAGAQVWYVNYANLLNREEAICEMQGALEFMEMEYKPQALHNFIAKAIREPLNRMGSIQVHLPQKTALLWQRLVERHRYQHSYN
jgi:hypothetical protein